MLKLLKVRNKNEKSQISSQKVSEELKLILHTLNNRGDILWFPKKETLSNFIIAIPMRLVGALRCVINHDIEGISAKDPPSPLADLVSWGNLSREGLKILYERGDEMEVMNGLAEDDIKFFLEELGLGT